MKNIIKKTWFHSVGLQINLLRMISAIFPSKIKRHSFRKKYSLLTYKSYLFHYYSYVLKNLPIKKRELNNSENNKIWVCWLQGEENAPNIVKACIKSIKKYKPNDMEVIVVNEKNLNSYIEIPNYIIKKKNKNCMSNTHFSDIIRVCLLEKYGGIWIDSTVLLTAPIPDDILKADFFAFSGSYYLSNSWFLKSNNAKIITYLKTLLFEYWKYEDRLYHYSLYHLFFDIIIENNLELKNEWLKVSFYDENNCYDLGDNYLLKQYDENIFKKILQKTSIHKLKYKYDKTKDTKGTFLEKILSL